jgi:hypothetical protein
MAKKREDRYASTGDMLEDLKAVARSDPPIHARRTIDLDSLAKVEETGKTVDLTPAIADQPFWERSAVSIWLFIALLVSGLLNLILILVVANR